MSAERNPSSIQIGVDILNARRDDETKSVLVQTGDVVGAASDGAASAEADDAAWWQHVGLVSLPPKPEAGKAAAQAVVVKRGDRDVVIGSRDLRGQELAGALTYGETCLYAAGEDGKGQARALLKKTGAIALYTRKGNVETGAGMGIFVDPDADQISIINSKGFGIVINADGVFVTAGASAGLSLKASGEVSLVGTGKCQVDGGGICLGSIAVPGVNSVLVGVTGIAGVASTKVLCALA